MKSLKNLIIIIIVGMLGIGNSYAHKPINDKSTKKSASSIKSLSAGCLPGSAMTELDLNNVRALILNGGDMWWDLGDAKYEIPKGSGKMSLFAGAIWVGGVDVNGQLRIATQMHRYGNDYWPGPLVTSGEAIASVTSSICTRYDRHYKITKLEVENFRAWYNADADTRAKDFANYSVPEIIENWPAHGPDVDKYDYYLAPFYDNNGDNYYNSDDGDYPYYDLDGVKPCNSVPERRAENLDNESATLFGDQTLWWVYNDKGNIHTASTGAAPIGMEFRAQAFAFSTNDELNNMTFYNYQIINRSTYILKNAYFGVWTDADLGDHTDDYVGCDVNKGLGYLYNGDNQDGDGSGKTYGSQPPAIGIDFFEGPYQDPDSCDNLSNWYDTGLETGTKLNTPVCNELISEGSINGLNFGDGVKDNERWGMRRFLYFNIGASDIGDPQTAIEFYNYLQGIWKDNTKLQYGGTGHQSGGAEADFMFPNDTDPCGWGTNGVPQVKWSEETEQNEPADRRLVQSAGPFILEPGAVNDITIGAVWARATSGGAWASVEEVRRADNKAQKLFEACFQVVDGPDSPELEIIELDKKFIFHIWNPITSNNYLESYYEKDPFIECPIEDGVLTDCDMFYSFQGYQVYQLSGPNVSITDIRDLDKARLVFQCDKIDGVDKIINYEWNDEMEANVPTMEVNGLDEGISHTFEISEDLFASGDRSLVNHRKYYFIAVAYAHNDYLHYNQNDIESIAYGQKIPYKAGRKSALGGIDAVEAIPHINSQFNGGTIINSEFGNKPAISMLEGHGNGNNFLELTEQTIEKIMAGGELIDGEYNWRADTLNYKISSGPINVKVIDPINVPDAEFLLKLEPDSVHRTNGYYVPSGDGINSNSNGLIFDTKWTLVKIENGASDTILSDNWIRFNDEKLIPEWGISVSISQVNFPGEKYTNSIKGTMPVNNGFIGATMNYDDPNSPWLNFVSDEEGRDPLNWIRVGGTSDSENPSVNDYILRDDQQIYEKVLGGTWAPYILTSYFEFGPAFSGSNPNSVEFSKYRLSSVDVVITKDKSKWTRCPVVEMCENDKDPITEDFIIPAISSLSEGKVLKLDLRHHGSMDKDGIYATMGEGSSDNENDPNFISDFGMSWFPGYAIDVETGERLNMMFGENSKLVGVSGRDMIWNPPFQLFDNLYLITGGLAGQALLGASHYIYVIGHNDVVGNINTPYDYGAWMVENLNGSSVQKGKAFKHAMWVSLPTINPNFNFVNYDDMPDNDVTIKLRTANPYQVNVKSFERDNVENNNYPLFKFNTNGIAASKQDIETAKSVLDKINVVPNPYYGFSEYERTQLDNIVKITNLPENCVISIYNTGGSLIRKYRKDSEVSYIDWDLKNNFGISIASGVYIIHIDAGEKGEKVLKWFGATRPVDLTTF